MARLSITTDEDLYRKLKKTAKGLGKSISELGAELIQRGLKEEKMSPVLDRDFNKIIKQLSEQSHVETSDLRIAEELEKHYRFQVLTVKAPDLQAGIPKTWYLISPKYKPEQIQSEEEPKQVEEDLPFQDIKLLIEQDN